MSCGYCGGLIVEGRTLAELVEKDFHRARWRQWFRRFVSRLRGGVVPAHLVCFAEERSQKTIASRRSLGIQTVELAKIEGSVGRC